MKARRFRIEVRQPWKKNQTDPAIDQMAPNYRGYPEKSREMTHTEANNI
jgi:hypothetical protein